MLSKLAAVPEACAMLPFVRVAYSQPSRYAWTDAGGGLKFIEQAEGDEQGDPLMPLLFSLGVHDALAAIRSELQEGEYLFAYLDD
eukprot:12424188-Karenia_brevis.AAC.1